MSPKPPPPPSQNTTTTNTTNHKTTEFQSHHTWSLVSLCVCIFSFGFTVVSVFPYSGFMAIELVDGANEENAGYYAGLISSAFMFGRALTSYHWGKAADVYGRVTVLYVSLLCSIIFTLLFGLSQSFALALAWRCSSGLGNGIMGTVKTVVSEIANGDKGLETRGMGIIVGMWGWSLLLSPAIAGALVQPISQYPHWWTGRQDTALYRFLQRNPFVLPNAVGALLCGISIVLVLTHVQETLPDRRHPKHIPKDIFRTFRSMLSTIPEGETEEEDDDDEAAKLLLSTSSLSRTSGKRKSGYGSLRISSARQSSTSTDNNPLLSPQIIAYAETDIEDSIRRTILSQSEDSTLLLSTANMSGELSHSIVKRASIVVEQNRMSRRITSIEESALLQDDDLLDDENNSNNNNEQMDQEEGEATMASLWALPNTRNHMIVYWLGNFIMVAVDEGLPLFLLSRQGGLSLSAKSIGTILSLSGGLFVVLQYVTYAKMVDLFGLYGTMRIGAISMSPFIALFPLVLLFNEMGRIAVYGTAIPGEEGLHYGDLTYGALAYLAVLIALFRVFFMAFLSSVMVAMNRTVIPSHRGTMNGFCTLGGSVTKTIGPSFAGLLVAFSLSSGFFPPAVGAVVLFLVLAGVGVMVTLAALFLLKEDEDEDE
mmetsp:Transcript_11477/g.31733  ORF Transcript_11477/g.31733 Transcript_11477/m.31733 type:complete len:653 (+) Transcript_11477:2196-4154(+)